MKYIYEFDSNAPRESLAVAYARYSSTNQNEVTIQTQLYHIHEYVQNKKLSLCGAYTDEARTGKHDRRSGFQKMIADAKEKPLWSHILVYDLSRFARNASDAGSYTADLEDLDIDIISVTQDFAPTPEGRLITNVMHGFNQYFSENLGKVCFDGMETSAKKGLHCGGIPPLGYDVDENRKLSVNEWEADAVRLIFNMYEQQYSYSQIANRFNELGYRTKAGQPFNKNSFSSILRQEKYCGMYIWNKASKKKSKGHRNTHKTKPTEKQVRFCVENMLIIPEDQFARVQKMMESRRGGKASINHRNYYLLSGLDILVCGECGSKLVGKTDNRSGKRYYYCPNHKRKECSMVDIKAEELEDFVTKRLAYEIYRRPDLVDVYNSVNPIDEIKKLGYHLRGIKTAINNTTKAIGKGTTPELEDKLKTLTADRDIVEARIHDLRAQQKTMTESDRKAVCRELEKFLKDAKNCEAKQYIRTTIDEILVSNESIQLTINAA